ncbi:transporter substrate-binding domain-containing protein [Halotalea alkalilenta]|nr:transporter substrate-binding domain-containing protein [Halotalea alkalilenta]
MNNYKPSSMLKILAAALVFAIGSQAAHADVLSDAKASGELKIATEFHFAPFAYLVDGQYAGLNLELMDEVGKRLGFEVSWIDLPWASVLPGLEAGNYDFVAGPAMVTRERQSRYAFTLPIADATVGLIKRENDGSIEKPEDVAGKRVGLQRGSAQADEFRAFNETLPEPATITEYVDFTQSMADLAARRVDAVANSLPNIAYTATQRPMFAVVEPTFGKPAYFAYMARNDAESASLVEAINETLGQMHEDGSLAALQTKWFGAPMDVPTGDFVPEL